MKIINLYGGPGAGKTTMAAYLFYRLKAAGFRAELVGEAAREIIYDRNPGVTAAQLIDNQFLISGLQVERIKRLERHGIEVAIADSPLRQGLAYVTDIELRAALTNAIARFEGFMSPAFNVFVQRTIGTYDKESRAQTEEQARTLDDKIWKLMRMHSIVRWGEEASLFDLIETELKRGWN
jgi:predicted ATPase